MTAASRPTLLDLLREQADALRAQEVAARQPIQTARHEIESRLLRAVRWLEEAIGHLEVIRPPVAHQFHLTNILTVDRPKFDGGFVALRRRGLATPEGLDHVEMYYRLVGPRPLVVRVHPSEVSRVEERLRASTLQYRFQSGLDEHKATRYGVFHVQPSIAASVRFQPHYERRVVAVTLRNVDRFESVLLEFEPDAIDEPALEDLVRFMLGESNAFLHRAPLAYLNRRRDEPQAATTP